MEASESDEEATQSRTRIVKNLIILSLAFLLVCSAVDGLQMLQSTLNREKGIGVISISIQFAFGCATALFLMKYIIMKFGSKNTIMFCLLAHIPSTTANFYPHWELMVPSYILLGIAATLLWGSNSAYLNGLSRMYSRKYERNLQNISGTKVEFPHLVNKLKEIDFPGHIKFTSDKIDNTGATMSNHNNDVRNTKELCVNFKLCKDGLDHKTELKNFKNLESVEKYGSCTTKSCKNAKSRDTSNQLLNNALSIERNKTQTLESSAANNDNNHDVKFFAESENWLTIPINSNDVFCDVNNKIKSNVEGEKAVNISDVEFEEINDLNQNKNKVLSNIIESTTARFFGFHSMLYQSGHIWSNIISYFVLQTGVLSENYIRDDSCMCGANFCNIESECFDSNLKEPTKELKYILISIFIAINTFSVILVAIFLDPLDQKDANVRYTLDFALASFKQLKKPKQLLLVPLSIYMGLSQGFFYADFPKAFVGCAWGMHHVGYVTIFFGITCSIMSTVSAWMVKYLGRRTIFLTAAAVNVAVNVLMLFWTPISTEPAMFFIVAGMWGFLMGSFWSQLKAFHGVLFKSNEEAAFGCYELSHSIGACMSFAYSNVLCVYVKIYVLLFVSSIGMIGYLTVEKIHMSEKLK